MSEELFLTTPETDACISKCNEHYSEHMTKMSQVDGTIKDLGKANYGSFGVEFRRLIEEMQDHSGKLQRIWEDLYTRFGEGNRQVAAGVAEFGSGLQQVASGRTPDAGMQSALT